MLEIINDYWVYFLIGQYPNGPLGGLVLTLLLASCGLVLALPLGIVLGLARVSPWRWLRWRSCISASSSNPSRSNASGTS